MDTKHGQRPTHSSWDNPLNNPDHDAASDKAMMETEELLLAEKRRECAPAKAPGDGENDGD